MRPEPVVTLVRNPWSETIVNGLLLDIIVSAAVNADVRLLAMIDRGELELDRDSFGMVFYDPTNPLAVRPVDAVLAIIQLGANGAKYVPNGAAKGWTHYMHGCCNGDLVDAASCCLGDDDFAWGDSAEYSGMIGGGSGLSVRQDKEMVFATLVEVADEVCAIREDKLQEWRSGGKSHGWYNPGNQPGEKYQAVLGLPQIAT